MLNRIRISSRLQLGFGVVVLVLFALATSLHVLLQGIHQRIEFSLAALLVSILFAWAVTRSIVRPMGGLTELGDALVDNVSRFRLRSEDFSS